MALDRGSKSMQITTAPRGHKRIHPEEPDGDQRLSKRLDRLSLDARGKCYVPVTAASQDHINNATSQSSSNSSKDDFMEVDNTKNRVYINDLDKELEEVESDEERPIFLPDIEKHLLKLPYSVLMNDVEKQRMENMQMVLYKIPSSLTVPEEQDSVRKAILEARDRARSKRLQSAEQDSVPSTERRESNKQKDSNDSDTDDLDAMDES